MEFLTETRLPRETAAKYGRFRPSQWETYTREAGVVAGIEQWQARLGRLAAEKIEQSKDERFEWLAESAERIAELQRFAADFHAALTAHADEATWDEHLAYLEGLAAAYADGVEPIIKALDDLKTLAAVAPRVTWAAFCRAVRDELESRDASSVLGEPVRRFGREGVAVVDATSLRHLRFRAVYMLGVAERAWPPPPRPDPLLLEHERARLNAAGAGVLPLRTGPDDEPLTFWLGRAVGARAAHGVIRAFGCGRRRHAPAVVLLPRDRGGARRAPARPGRARRERARATDRGGTAGERRPRGVAVAGGIRPRAREGGDRERRFGGDRRAGVGDAGVRAGGAGAACALGGIAHGVRRRDDGRCGGGARGGGAVRAHEAGIAEPAGVVRHVSVPLLHAVHAGRGSGERTRGHRAHRRAGARLADPQHPRGLPEGHRPRRPAAGGGAGAASRAAAGGRAGRGGEARSARRDGTAADLGDGPAADRRRPRALVRRGAEGGGAESAAAGRVRGGVRRGALRFRRRRERALDDRIRS